MRSSTITATNTGSSRSAPPWPRPGSRSPRVRTTPARPGRPRRGLVATRCWTSGWRWCTRTTWACTECARCGRRSTGSTRASRWPGAPWSAGCARWDWRGSPTPGRPARPAQLRRRTRARRTGSTATSPPRRPTNDGSQTSPTSRRGQGSSTSRSSWTSSPGGSWAGGCRRRCAPTSRWTPSSTPSGPGNVTSVTCLR